MAIRFWRCTKLPLMYPENWHFRSRFVLKTTKTLELLRIFDELFDVINGDPFLTLYKTSAYGFQTSFGVENKSFWWKVIFCAVQNVSGKIFRTRLKYFYFGLQVFRIYRKTGLEGLMFWKLFGYFWENSNFNLQLKKLDCMHQFGTVIYETFLICKR